MTFFALKIAAAAADKAEVIAGHLARLRPHIVPSILVTTFFAWSWGFDWVPGEDWSKPLGQTYYAVAGISAMAAVYMCKHFHWTVATFYLWAMLQWVRLRFAPASLIEITMLNAAIFAAIFIVKEDRKKLLATCLIIDCALQAALGLIEVAGYFPFHQLTNPNQVWAPIAASGHPTILGPYLALALPFIFTTMLVKNTTIDLILRCAAAGLIVACIGFTQSTMTAITCGVIVLLTIGFFFGMRALVIAHLLAGAAGLAVLKMFPAVGAFTGRLEHWDFAFRALVWQGYGAGTFGPVNFHRHVQQWRHYEEQVAAGIQAAMPNLAFFQKLHNDPLEAAFEFGKAGMIPLAIGVAVLLGITLRGIRRRDLELYPWACMFFGIAVDSLGSYPLHTLPMGVLFAVSACRMFQHDPVSGTIRRHYETEA